MTAIAAREGLLLCDTCSLLNRGDGKLHPACARCGAHLYARKPGSLVRTWAFLLSAAILYVPANLLPVIESGSLFESQIQTIWSGVVYLWVTGSWFLAAIVFTASIVIPASKILSLSFLALSAQRRSRWKPLQRARIYRITHYIGRWSMVDIFVGAMLVGLVQFKSLASIVPGPGAIFFAAVVVLTMLASASFDPRLTWDPLEDGRGR